MWRSAMRCGGVLRRPAVWANRGSAAAHGAAPLNLAALDAGRADLNEGVHILQIEVGSRGYRTANPKLPVPCGAAPCAAASSYAVRPWGRTEGPRRRMAPAHTYLRDGVLGDLLNLAALDAGRTYLNPFRGPVNEGVHILQIEVPAALAYIVGVAHAVTEPRPAPAYITRLRHDSILPNRSEP